ncbi:MAG: chorismate synthase [Clostridiales bacterium]|jgi:chorismate synthase|nr:chorismate synthase [Clostridiales bacterium]
MHSITESGKLKIEIIGESHDERIGVIIKGFPVGTAFSSDCLAAFMARRAPGVMSDEPVIQLIAKKCSTSRKEPDEVVFEKGVISDGGECIAAEPVIEAYIYNKNHKSSDYKQNLTKLRPGHADLGAFLSYGIDGLKPGGGKFSGRMTAPVCVAGYIAISQLYYMGIGIRAEIDEIGGVPFDKDSTTQIESICDRIDSVKESGDSLGGVIKLTITGYPAGIGGAGLNGIEGDLARLLYSIPSVKGVEFGSGFYGSRLTGSQNNDEYHINDGRILTWQNRQGGISGGISTGMDITARIAFKPVPSINKEQNTIDVDTMQECILSTIGRHDVCVVPRALPIVEAYSALVLYDRLN